jgi:hypothetical protein
VPAPPQEVADLAQRALEPFPHRLALELEASLPVSCTDVREAEEVEGLRLAQATTFTVAGGEPPELDQARLGRVQRQLEPGESLAELVLEPLRVPAMLEPHHEVVRIAHDDHVAACMPTPPLVRPQVQHVVQVDVRQEGADAPSLRRTLRALRADPALHEPSPQPLSQQAKHARIPDPVLDETSNGRASCGLLGRWPVPDVSRASLRPLR